MAGSISAAVAAVLLAFAVIFSTARGVWLAAYRGGRAARLSQAARRGALLLGAARRRRGGRVVAWSAGPSRAGGADLHRRRRERRAHRHLARQPRHRARPSRSSASASAATADRGAAVLRRGIPEADRRSHAHSNYLQLAAEAGLVGLAAFASSSRRRSWRGWSRRRAARDDRDWATAAGAWTGIVAFLVGGLTQYNFGDSEVALDDVGHDGRPDALRGSRLMDVLHVDPERGWGGGEVQVLALLRELAARGHRSRLAAHPAGRLAREAPRSAIAGASAPRSRTTSTCAPASVCVVWSRGHDVVHFHTARAHALAPFCRGLGARLVVTRRMDYVPRGGPYARWLYNRAVDVVIAISQGVRDGARRGPACGPSASASCRAASTPAAMQARPGAARRAPRAAWGIARGRRARPGARVRSSAARATRSCSQPRRQLAARHRGCATCSAAAGSEEAALRPAGGRTGRIGRVRGPADRRRGLPGRGRHRGACPPSRKGSASPRSRRWRRARPLVASRVGGLAEVVADGESGLLVAPGDPASLAAALARLGADPAATPAARGGGARSRPRRATPPRGWRRARSPATGSPHARRDRQATRGARRGGCAACGCWWSAT